MCGDLTHLPLNAEVWGTAGQWVSSLLTAGSLLLGYSILRINQQDKRRAQASLITFSAVYSQDMETDLLSRVKGTVYNHSQAPITNVAIVVEMNETMAKRRSPRIERFINPIHSLIVYHHVRAEEDLTSTIMPNESVPYELQVSAVARLRPEDVVVKLTFLDANSVTWDRATLGIPREHKFHGPVRDWARKVLASRKLKIRALSRNKNC